MKRLLILDGYVDEPANFGVPPYVSPHARYIAGAAKAADPATEVHYLTIDEWRRGSPKRKWLAESDLLVMVAGALVPGKYLRGTPVSWREAQEICADFGGEKVIAGASALYGFGRGGGLPPAGRNEMDRVFTYRARLHADALVHDVLTGAVHQGRHGIGINRKRSLEEWADWSVRGAFIVREHPDHPQPLIAEIDTYHGCVRYVNGGCAFCMEPKEGKPLYLSLIHI